MTITSCYLSHVHSEANIVACPMGKPNTNPPQNKIPYAVVLMLRLERGSVTRIARALHRSPSHVSKVLSGARTSDRVRRAILHEAMQAARRRGVMATLRNLSKVTEI
jgi:hypothetical protein